MTDDDQSLLERASTLDESALAEIFDTYYVSLYRYIYTHVGHVETAEDLAAEVFHRLLAGLHNGRGPRRRLKPWLFRVAHNVVVDDIRRQSHRNHLPLDEHVALLDESPVDEQAEQAVLMAATQQALAHLTPKQRAVITLKFVAGMDNAEVAHSLSLPVGAVKALQHRGLAALRRTLSSSPWALENDTT